MMHAEIVRRSCNRFDSLLYIPRVSAALGEPFAAIFALSVGSASSVYKSEASRLVHIFGQRLTQSRGGAEV